MLTVTLDPIGKSGRVRERIDLITDAPSDPVITVYITAQVDHTASDLSSAVFQQTVFGPRCEGCHGRSAAGTLAGDDLYGAVCAMCHPSPGSLAGGPVSEVRTAIAQGQLERGMPAYAARFGGPLDDAQIESLVEVVRR